MGSTPLCSTPLYPILGADATRAGDDAMQARRAGQDSYRAQVEERIARLLEALEGRHEARPSPCTRRGARAEVRVVPTARYDCLALRSSASSPLAARNGSSTYTSAHGGARKLPRCFWDSCLNLLEV